MGSTDIEWEKWGRRDPYFGVITSERFRTGSMDEEARAEFFASGTWHMQAVLKSARAYFDPDFRPRRVLDFGCGVGRVLIPFAEVADEAVGVDVSASMLAEARRNCAERGIGNVVLVTSDDELSQVEGRFDLIHSAITLQHIEVPRGRRLFARLVDLLAPQGVGAIQITYGKAYLPESHGQPLPPVLPELLQPAATSLGRLLRRGAREIEAQLEAPAGPGADPEMMMNPYNLSELAFLLQTAGVERFHAEFTDHGGELGVFLYFRRPAAV